MNDKQQDRHLQTPSEANREKHINFMEVEENGNRTSGKQREEDKSETQRTWEKMREENNNNE